MSSRYHRSIAKEIVDQAISQTKKQRENAARKQSERKSEELYKPDLDFHKVFTGIIGQKEKTGPLQVAQKTVETERKEESFNKSVQPSVFERLKRLLKFW